MLGFIFSGCYVLFWVLYIVLCYWSFDFYWVLIKLLALLWNKDKYNANQSSRDEIYLTLIYNKEEEIREESWENEKEREKEWEKEFFFLFLEMSITGNGKSFYRLSKWLPLISPLMNINETHK